MKKILAAILAGTFGLTAVAQTVVYDYKASFKRINPVYKIRKENKIDYVTESYGVSSDSISGYVILPVCDDCTGPVASSTANSGHAYLTRKGDKYSKNASPKIPFVVKVNVTADSAIFGTNAYILGTSPADTTPSDKKNLKSAWMKLNFAIPAPVNFTMDAANPTKVAADGAGHHILANQVVKKLAVDSTNPLSYIWYGFMGMDSWRGGSINNSGFGSVKILSGSTSSTLGLCGPTVSSTPECRLIQSISGSTLGDFQYQGICGGTPMWDLCAPNTANQWQPLPFNDHAPIAGTWTLKLNTSMTTIKGTNAADKRAKQEQAILKKLKATAADVYDVSTAWSYVGF